MSGDSPDGAWQPLTYTWTASALCHKPLYFDDEHLERYGHMLGPWLQPIVSHGRFFVNVLILPYEMGLEARPTSVCTPWATIGPAVVRRITSIRFRSACGRRCSRPAPGRPA